ncbi:hypothetical protein BDV32DRAFT_15565 [Aspergillus pseudonomiae]|nr:hypothetical protein BDV32DRAFT_15565 [Aspergillus pseudonomiae]
MTAHGSCLYYPSCHDAICLTNNDNIFFPFTLSVYSITCVGTVAGQLARMSNCNLALSWLWLCRRSAEIESEISPTSDVLDVCPAALLRWHTSIDDLEHPCIFAL